MDEHKIAKIIENYFPGDVPDDLREAYEDYFVIGGKDEDSSEDSEQEDGDPPQPVALDENVQDFNIDDIPVST